MFRFGLAALVVALVASAGSANAQYGQPGGSYLRSCRDISFDGANLMATCRGMGGGSVTTILDTRACARPDVNNDNGRLTCSTRNGGSIAGREVRQRNRDEWNGGGRPGYGSDGYRPRNNWGEEDYGAPQRPRNSWGDNDYGAPQRPRGNNWGGPPAPGGSYTRSCRIESFDGTILTALCRTTDDETVRSRLDVGRCGRGDIGNNNGRLVCSR